MNITIREAQLKDLFEISLKAKEAYIDYKVKFKFNPVYFYEQCEKLLKVGGKILLAEKEGKLVGALGFFIANDFFHETKIASELFWYSSDSKCGMILLKEFENLAKSENCGMIKLSLIVSSKAEKLDLFYLRKGYTLLEKYYIKEV